MFEQLLVASEADGKRMAWDWNISYLQLAHGLHRSFLEISVVKAKIFIVLPLN